MELELENMEGEPWIHTDYQYDFLMDYGPQVSLSCARAVGKCLDKDSRILNTKTGEYRTVEDWYYRGLEGLPSLDHNWQLSEGKPTIEYNGVKDCLTVGLEKGFETTVTFEHPFLTNEGWKDAQDLKIGDYVAIPNKLDFFGSKEMSESDVIILAHFIAEGSRKSCGISTTEPEVVKELEGYAHKHSLKLGQDKCTYYLWGTPGKKSYYIKLLERLGLRFCYSYEKFIPQEIFRLNKDLLGLFLNRLFGGDGWATNSEIGYCSTSERLARDVVHLLLRFGIVSTLNYKENEYRGSWHISIKGYDNVEKFHEYINFHIPRKRETLEKLLSSLDGTYNQACIIPIPSFRDYRVRSTQAGRNDTVRPLQYFPTKKKAETVINRTGEFEKFLNSNIWWVRVKKLEYVGKRETYAVEVNPHHTHVVDDIYSHNTEALVTKIMWHAINGWHDSALFTVPNRSHLDPVFLGLQKRFRANKFLQWWVNRYSVNSQQFLIKFLNNFTLICRIAGTSGTGVNVVGLHVPIIILDESAYYPWGTWLELQPVINDWVPGYQIIVSGVPDGRREKSVCYHCDTNPTFNTHHVSAYQNPRFTKEAEERAVVQYGGRDSEDFKRQVLGEHGTPTFAVFDRELLRLEDYDVPAIRLYGAQLKKDSQLPYRVVLNLPAIPRYAETAILGIDLGYTQPTAINALYKLEGENHWYFLFRLELHQVSYDVQEKIINRLDTKYNPAYIGMDIGAGGQGKSLYHNFVNKDVYKVKDFAERMVPVEFGGTIVVGKDEEGEDLKERVKQFSVSKLQQMVNNHEICFSTRDGDLITELERITYHRTTSGNVVYKALTPGGSDRGDDHNFAALLCFVMVLFEKYDLQSLRTKKAKLFRSRWIT
jgi:intein/homing endonuclease